MKDYTGREIQVGDRIVFPRRQGSQMWVTDAVVTEIDHLNGGLRLDNKHVLERVDRCVVVTSLPPTNSGLHYYVHRHGYLDNTAYVVVDDSKKDFYCVRRDGSRGLSLFLDSLEGWEGLKGGIEEYVKEGSWLEVTPRV